MKHFANVTTELNIGVLFDLYEQDIIISIRSNNTNYRELEDDDCILIPVYKLLKQQKDEGLDSELYNQSCERLIELIKSTMHKE